MPSEEERQKREQLADEAREAEERAAAAAQKATEARKNLRKAKKENIDKQLAAEKVLRAAEEKAALEEQKARAKIKDIPHNWQPTEAGLIRRFGKKLAASLIAAWRAIGNQWDKFKTGDLMRLLTDETGSLNLGGEQKPKPYDLNNLSEEDKKALFGAHPDLFEWWKETYQANVSTREDVNFYKNRGYKEINNALRSRGTPPTHLKQRIDRLSKMLRNSIAPKDLMLYRGVGDVAILAKMFPSLASQAHSAQEWVKVLQAELRNGDLPYSDKAFMSASLNPKKAFETKVRLEIEVDEGQNGVAFVIGRNNRDFQLQQEILIDHGAKLVCSKVRFDKGDVVLKCRVDELR